MSITTLEQVINAKIKLTPMMEQYYHIKKNFEDYLLLFRMGDFYELFFEDAERASKILNITLTHRGKLGDLPIPMAGIPHHAASTYIDRLSDQNYKVAICEQVQDPKEAKGIVKRAVTQIVSPGMPYDLNKTQARDERNMLAGFFENDEYYLVSVDFTTGKFEGSIHQDKESFLNQIKAHSPKELVTFIDQWEHCPQVNDLCNHLGVLKTHLSADYFESGVTSIYIEKLIKQFESDKILKQNPKLLHAIGALSYYICSTQNIDELFHIEPFRLKNSKKHMKLTIDTLVGLEILPKSRDQYKQSLLGYLDRCQSSIGSRRLKSLVIEPLLEEEEIKKRQEIIKYFLKETTHLEETRDILSDVRDLERILAKLSTDKATPSDLLNIERSIVAFEMLEKMLPAKLKKSLQFLAPKDRKALQSISKTIKQTINDEIGASLDKGNLILEGVCKERDRLARLSLKSNDLLAKLEEKYREETGIPKLRVKSNNVAGYFIEVSKTQTHLVPDSFNRKQTLVNSERYLTVELKELEKEINHSKFKLFEREREILKEIISELQLLSPSIQRLAYCLSMSDALQSLSWVALQDQFSCPQISETQVFETTSMWHPLIKSLMINHFVPHDLKLDQEVRFGLITGPNMAGKTTVMREVAIVQILSQMGSFVPALRAKVSLCDYLFSRLGAGDDILKGQSTFMMEMSETAEIIRHATERSLIILDEVGRGTSTYDGLSIAWALVEDIIYQKKSMTLFATHYHELIDVIDGIEEAKNLTVKIHRDGQHIEFLYQLIETSASQSFGIHVARLAGLPNRILYRASDILEQLELEAKDHPKEKEVQLNLFQNLEKKETQSSNREVLRELKDTELNSMTPLQALNLLHELKSKLIQEENA